MLGKMSFDKVARAVLETPRQQPTLLIGVDGGGGAGKSTFARSLLAAFTRLAETAMTVHTDDFFRPFPGQLQPAMDGFLDGEIDWRRLLSQVVSPIKEGRSGRFQRYDWPSRSLQEWHVVDAGGIVIVEGIRALRRELAPLYDYRVWVECSRAVRLNRGVARDGEKARSRWELNWLPGDDRFVEEHRPQAIADLVVDGSGHSGIDPGQFIHYLLAR